MHRTTTLRLGTALLATASTLCFAAPTLARDVLFSTTGQRDVADGQRTNQQRGLTQVRLDNGATASFVDAADYRINADGTIDLYAGSVTVSGAEGATIVRMPQGTEGQVAGAGSAASFTVGPDGTGRGHVLNGSATIGGAGAARRFDAGEMFAFAPGQRARQVVANGAQPTPDAEGAAPVMAMGAGAGPVAAAQNGMPVTLGDALAATGASGDILAAARRVEAAAANPAIDTFPVGDLQLLVAAAGRLEGAYGGTPFSGAQADVIRTYLQFLATRGSGQDFLSAYAGFLGNYLDLIRSGSAPSGFTLASPEQIDSFIAFADRTGRFGDLSAQDKVLVNAYLAFIRAGGTADAFAGSFTDLTSAYFAFVRGGGDPAAFTGATQATLDAYIAFLADSGLLQQLPAADRALVAAYLQNGGLAFAGQYRSALDAYFAYLAAGNLPSNYGAIDQATLQSYLATLQSTGLLANVLGDNADFYTAYLAYLQAGGSVDGFAGLPANVFAGYATQLDAYFAFLAGGNLPSGYGAADIATLQAYLAELQAAGALDRFLGNQAGFYADYLAFLQGGGQADAFARLNANIFSGYASALAAYYDYLANGGIPSAYGALTQDQIAAYVAALQAAGATDGFLAGLADFYTAYFAFLNGGGNPDNFAGLPVPPDFPAFADALNAYAAFLAGGGLPSGYSAQDLAVLQDYLAAIIASGQLGALLGANADLLQDYFAYLASGGVPDGFTGLPVYADYVSALNAYFAFLDAGGLPADYTALTPAQVQAYLDALAAAGGLLAYGDLDGFFSGYYAFLLGGGDPAAFAGLPAYADYVAALNAYYAYLANGGVPSAYTALTPAQIQAYLDALAGVTGGFASFAALDAFFATYYTYLVSGGDPDQFAGLPGTTPPVSLAQGANIWVLASRTISTGTAPTADVTADGQITRTDFVNDASSTSVDFTAGAFELREKGRIGDTVAWSRYVPSASGNTYAHVLLGSPAVNLPATGTVDYRLVGGTSPTSSTGPAEETGSFEGNLSVLFGSTPLVGLDFDVYFGTRGWHAQTAGGAADPGNGGLALDDRGRFDSVGSIATTGIAGDACVNLCRTFVQGGLFGDGASNAGLVYFIREGLANAAGSDEISGIAVFGTTGTELDMIGTRPGSGTGGTASPYAGTVTGLDVLTTQFGLPGSTLSAYGNSTATFDGNGRIATYTASNGSQAGSGVSPADTDAETGSIDGAVAWARFLDPNNNQGTLEHTGIHTIVGTPATNLPTTGTVTYALVGGTLPTTNEGTEAPGSFAGQLAVDFATQRVGVDFDIAIAQYRWNMATAGGAADPANGGMAINGSSRTYFASGLPLTGLNAASCVTSCTGNIVGDFFGNGGSHTGLVYSVFDSGFAARGSAVFAAPGAAGTPIDRLGTLPVTGPVAATSDGVAPTGAAGNYFTYIGAGGSGSATATAMEVTNGALISATSSRDSVQYVSNTNTTSTVGGDQGVIGWSRFGNVTTNYRTGTGQGFVASPFASQFWHNAWGAPAVNLPASGLVNYELIGSTLATQTNAQPGEGVFTGNFAVDFATLKAGLAAQVAFNGETYSFASTGGVAAPSIGLFDDGLGARRFSDNLATTNSAGGNVTRGTFVQGFLAGDGASHAGLTYAIRLSSSNAIQGAAAFRAAGSAAAAKPADAAIATAPVPQPLAIGGDWSRFTGATPTAGVAPGLVSGTGAIATPADRKAAETLLGGMITFGKAPTR